MYIALNTQCFTSFDRLFVYRSLFSFYGVWLVSSCNLVIYCEFFDFSLVLLNYMAFLHILGKSLSNKSRIHMIVVLVRFIMLEELEQVNMEIYSSESRKAVHCLKIGLL